MSRIKTTNHIDGAWHTSDHSYKGYKLTIKMQSCKGCKIHIWNKEASKVVKTLRYNFSSEASLLEKAYRFIEENSIPEEKAKFFEIFELTGTYPM